MESPAPGWYPDPDRSAPAPSVRWWDGAAWTSHVAPAASGQPAGGPSTPDGVAVADWGRRLAAYLVDAFFVSMVAMVVQIPALIWWFRWYAELLESTDPVTGRVPADAFDDMFGHLLVLMAISLTVGVVLNFTYHSICLRLWSATPGKRILGLRVRRWDAEGPLGWATILRRTGTQFVAFGILSVLLLQYLDGLWPLWDRRRQALHDKVAATVVVAVSQVDGR